MQRKIDYDDFEHEEKVEPEYSEEYYTKTEMELFERWQNRRDGYGVYHGGKD